jgi:hypothetical protein
LSAAFKVLISAISILLFLCNPLSLLYLGLLYFATGYWWKNKPVHTRKFTYKWGCFWTTTIEAVPPKICCWVYSRTESCLRLGNLLLPVATILRQSLVVTGEQQVYCLNWLNSIILYETFLRKHMETDLNNSCLNTFRFYQWNVWDVKVNILACLKNNVQKFLVLNS